MARPGCWPILTTGDARRRAAAAAGRSADRRRDGRGGPWWRCCRPTTSEPLVDGLQRFYDELSGAAAWRAYGVTCSVCIPTYRRPTELTACLGALTRQVTPPDEVIISDAGGDEETHRVIGRYREAVRGGPPWRVRHCRTTRTGLPWQRWWAFRHATGSIALFIDDDVRPEPEAVARLLETYRRLPDIAGAAFAIAYDGDIVHRRRTQRPARPPAREACANAGSAFAARVPAASRRVASRSS